MANVPFCGVNTHHHKRTKNVRRCLIRQERHLRELVMIAASEAQAVLDGILLQDDAS